MDFTLLLICTLALEGVTLLGRRLSGGMRRVGENRWGALLRKLTFGIRVHHGYIGAVLWFAGHLTSGELLMFIGAVMFWSDILHHTLLWVVTGDPEYDIVWRAP